MLSPKIAYTAQSMLHDDGYAVQLTSLSLILHAQMACMHVRTAEWLSQC